MLQKNIDLSFPVFNFFRATPPKVEEAKKDESKEEVSEKVSNGESNGCTTNGLPASSADHEEEDIVANNDIAESTLKKVVDKDTNNPVGNDAEVTPMETSEAVAVAPDVPTTSSDENQSSSMEPGGAAIGEETSDTVQDMAKAAAAPESEVQESPGDMQPEDVQPAEIQPEEAVTVNEEGVNDLGQPVELSQESAEAPAEEEIQAQTAQTVQSDDANVESEPSEANQDQEVIQDQEAQQDVAETTTDAAEIQEEQQQQQQQQEEEEEELQLETAVGLVPSETALDQEMLPTEGVAMQPEVAEAPSELFQNQELLSEAIEGQSVPDHIQTEGESYQQSVPKEQHSESVELAANPGYEDTGESSAPEEEISPLALEESDSAETAASEFPVSQTEITEASASTSSSFPQPTQLIPEESTLDLHHQYNQVPEATISDESQATLENLMNIADDNSGSTLLEQPQMLPSPMDSVGGPDHNNMLPDPGMQGFSAPPPLIPLESGGAVDEAAAAAAVFDAAGVTTGGAELQPLPTTEQPMDTE